jgi:hypothetical protein
MMMLFNAVSAATSVTPPSVNAKRSGANLSEIKNLTKDFPKQVQVAVLEVAEELEQRLSKKPFTDGHIGVFPTTQRQARGVCILFSPANDSLEQTELCVRKNGSTVFTQGEEQPIKEPYSIKSKSPDEKISILTAKVRAFAKAIGLAEPENK